MEYYGCVAVEKAWALPTVEHKGNVFISLNKHVYVQMGRMYVVHTLLHVICLNIWIAGLSRKKFASKYFHTKTQEANKAHVKGDYIPMQ